MSFMHAELRVRRVAASMTVGVTLALGAWLYAVEPAWEAWRPASCWPAGCFCEAIRAGAVRQPANTWSSLAFVVAALGLLSGAGAARRSATAPAAPGAEVAFALTLALVGLGSAFFHASLTFAGQFVDVFGMYLAVTLIALVELARARGLPPRRLLPALAGLNAALALALLLLPAARRFLFGGLVLAVLAAGRTRPSRALGEAPPRRLASWQRAALVLLAAGALSWALDITHAACAPRSWIQGHALWHLLTAGAAVCYWRHVRAAARS